MFSVGDRVCAIAAGSIANIARCKADCAVKLPDSISFPDGASIPLIYCTAQYCLANVARLKHGETILIHAVRLPQPNISSFKQIGITEIIFPQKDNADLDKYNRQRAESVKLP